MPSSPHHETILKSLPIFNGMDNDLLHGLLVSTRFVKHNKNEIFLEQGQLITRFYIIVEGWCGAVKNNAEGQESILQIFRRGDFLPEPTINLSKSPLSLQALTNTYLAMLSPGIVRNALEHSPQFAANMLKASTQRCDDLRTHVEQLTLHSAEQRLGRFLLDMKLMSDDTEQEIVLPFDKSMIAGYLGIKPETLSRALQSFRDNGFAVDHNHLQMPSPFALCTYCDLATEQKCLLSETEHCPNYQPQKRRLKA